MKKLFSILSLTIFISNISAQVNSSNLTYPDQNKAQNNEINSTQEQQPNKSHSDINRWRFGGGVGLSFGSHGYFTVQVSPSVGYALTNNVEAGLVAGYMYAKDDYSKQNIFNVGPYVNYYPIQNIFLRANYMYYTGTIKSDYYNFLDTDNARYEDKFDESALWLGAGYQSSGLVRFQVGILYNVLYKENESRFSSAWQPFMGVAFGF